MKKITILAALTTVAVGAYAQGTLTFSNRPAYVGGSAAENAVVTRGVPNVVDGTRLSGDAYKVQLYWAAGANAPESSLQAIGNPLSFATGGAAGFFGPEVITIPVAPNSTITVQVRAWNSAGGATYEAANANLASGITGVSPTFTITGLGDPNAQPPGVPANITGLRSFFVTPVPEPSVVALGLLGAGLLFLRRRN